MTLKEQLVRDEGLRLTPYLDTVGKWTIGVGRNLSDIGISKAEADFLLENDIARTKIALNHVFPWTANLDEVRRAAFINLAFNIGIESLKSFVNTMAAAERRDWPTCAAGIRASKYYRQVGARGERVARQLETGEWQ